MTSGTAVDYFQKRHWLIGMHAKLSLYMRRKMFAALPWTSAMRVLEVGCTPEMEMVDANYFSRAARALGCKVSVSSPEDCSTMAAAFDLQWIAFADLVREEASAPSFDAVVSSAVLEHVGSSDTAKLAHLALLRRHSQRFVLITTPNRGHWFEIHTKLPLVHWLPKAWHRRLLSGLRLRPWDDPEHLDLVTFAEFKRLIETSYSGCKISYRRFYFLGAVSNLMAIIDCSAT